MKFTVLEKRWKYAFVTVEAETHDAAIIAVTAGEGHVRESGEGERKLRVVSKSSNDDAWSYYGRDIQAYDT